MAPDPPDPPNPPNLLDRWDAYYAKTESRAPRPRLLEQLEAWRSEGRLPGLAIDLGCGAGVETIELLRDGWRVVAIDAQASAIRSLLERVPADSQWNLTTQIASFTEAMFPECDLVWSSAALPFCPREELPPVLERIALALRPGGVLAVDFFGARHAWADRAEICAVTSEEIERWLSPLVVTVREFDELRPTAFDGPQRWHGYDVVGRKS